MNSTHRLLFAGAALALFAVGLQVFRASARVDEERGAQAAPPAPPEDPVDPTQSELQVREPTDLAPVQPALEVDETPGTSSPPEAEVRTEVGWVIEPPEEWARIYEQRSIAELETELEAVSTEADKRSELHFQELLEAGEYEVIGVGGVRVELPEVPQGTTQWVSAAALTGEQRYIALPKEDYPEYYALRAKAQWLEGEIERRMEALKSARPDR